MPVNIISKLKLTKTPTINDSRLYREFLDVYNAIQVIYRFLKELTERNNSIIFVLDDNLVITSGNNQIFTRADSSDCNIILPSPASMIGLPIKIRQLSGTNDTNVTCSTGANVNGVTSSTIATGQFFTYASDGTEYWRV